MRVSTWALALAILAIASAPSLSQSDSTPAGLVSANVMDFGATADGVTDDTAAFQRALDSVKEKGGVVLAPTGTYLFEGSLNVHQGVTLRGVWEAPHHSSIGKGTLFLTTGGAGENAGAFINLVQDSCIKGVTIMHPNQKLDNITPYPWAIEGRGMHCSVIDVTLVNPYRGIRLCEWNELHYVKNVYGCPLMVGVAVDNCTDVGRIEDVHFNPHYWVRAAHPSVPKPEDGEKLIKYLNENLVAFRIGKTDWQYMTNCFSIFAKIGFHFIKTAGGEPNAVLTQCGADIGPIAIQVDASQFHAGLAFNNCQIMAGVVISETNHGPVKFTNCGFWGYAPTDYHIKLEGKSQLIVNGCHFIGWDQRERSGAYAIDAKSGDLIVSASDFMDSKPHIYLGSDVNSAVITGNRFRGGQNITNESKGDVQIGLNAKQ